jgi:predicted nucleic acid-binding protein
MIVVDTNIIGYLFFSSERSEMAERTLRIDRDWAAPVLWRSEFCNALALYLRKGIVALPQAQQMMTAATDLLRGREYEASSYEVLRIASESHCSAYDCEFVAVANELKIPLITVDKQLLRTFPAVAVSLQDFVVK